MRSVSRANLGQLKELAEGGFGKVYHALNFRLGNDPSAIAFKEFTREVAAQAEAAKNAVSFRDSLSPADRADLDQCTVWPRAVVEEQGTVIGLLMPLISDEFRFQPTGQTGEKVRDLQWLIAAPTVLQQNGVEDVDETERLVLLAQLVYDVARLHRQDWIFGDLSFKNAAFTATPPRVILLDCDGAANLGNPQRQQEHSLGWAPPECAQGSQQDKATDVYKLGLAVLRCLNPGKGAATMRDPGRLASKLDSTGAALIARAVDDDRAKRPTAKELYSYLRRLVASRTSPPEVITARLATPLRVRGMDARIEWEIANVSEVTIRVGSGPPTTLPVAASGLRMHVFPARESGPVTLEAENRYGSVRVDLSELVLYEIPPFDPQSLVGTLPRLAVPPLEALTLDALDSAIATMPRVAAPELPGLPAIPTGDLTAVLRETLQPAGRSGQRSLASSMQQSIRLPDLGELIAGPTREIADLLTSQARSFATSQRASHLKAMADTEEDD
jgi:serine/threonine protein kinase